MSVGVFNAETNETKDVANKSRTAIIDSEMSEESQNPLQNRVITQKITELNQSIEELNTLLNGMDETLGGKLDVSKIANNLVTTEEGYALDARMGKALAKSIGDRLKCSNIDRLNANTSQKLSELTGSFFIDGWNYKADKLPTINGMGVCVSFDTFEGRHMQMIIGFYDAWNGHIYTRADNSDWITLI